MTLDIAAINARADAATSGPWAKNPFTAHVDAFEQGYPIPVCALLWPTDLRTEDQSIADGEFIAHTRTDIPDLLAALEASETARVKAERERDALIEQLKMPDADRRQWLLSELVSTIGYFNRADLCEAFGISIPQASTDIRRFLTKFPGLVEYDKTAKRYARRALEAKP